MWFATALKLRKKSKSHYGKEPKIETILNSFTFFCVVIIQSEAIDSLQLASDWTKFAQKYGNKLNIVMLLVPLALSVLH